MIQSDIRERGGDFSRPLELGGRTAAHRRRRIEKKRKMNALFGGKFLDEKSVMTRVDIPIDIPDLVPGGVRSVFGKFDRAPFAGRKTLSRILPGTNFSHENPQRFERAYKILIERHVGIIARAFSAEQELGESDFTSDLAPG